MEYALGIIYFKISVFRAQAKYINLCMRLDHVMYGCDNQPKICCTSSFDIITIRGVARTNFGVFTTLLGGSGGMLPQKNVDSVSLILVNSRVIFINLATVQ